MERHLLSQSVQLFRYWQARYGHKQRSPNEVRPSTSRIACLHRMQGYMKGSCKGGLKECFRDYAKHYLLTLLLGPLLSGCMGLAFLQPIDSSLLSEITVSAMRKEVPDSILHVLGKPDDLWGRMAWGFTWDRQNHVVHQEIERIVKQPGFFDLLSERALPALPWIISEIERLKLPMELALVPIVESMLDPWAYSSQRAAGLWQISPATASHYGLEINWWYDARLDIPVATEFALSYLVELQQEFDNDWQLALAAYNGGRGRVARAQRKAQAAKQPQGYWQLKLPRETQRYIPRILALAEIISHPARYNLTLPKLPGQLVMQHVPTHGQIELSRAAQLAHMDAGALRRMNPAQLRWATAPAHPDTLWMPTENGVLFAMGLRSLSAEERVEWAHYTIAPGDSLSAIAQRFDTQIALIQSVNALAGSLIRAGDTLMIPKGQLTANRASVAYIDWPPRRPQGSNTYRVRTGDSLWSIAQRYGLPARELARLNKLDPSQYLQPGQRLRVR